MRRAPTMSWEWIFCRGEKESEPTRTVYSVSKDTCQVPTLALTVVECLPLHKLAADTLRTASNEDCDIKQRALIGQGTRSI